MLCAGLEEWEGDLSGRGYMYAYSCIHFVVRQKLTQYYIGIIHQLKNKNRS